MVAENLTLCEKLLISKDANLIFLCLDKEVKVVGFNSRDEDSQ